MSMTRSYHELCSLLSRIRLWFTQCRGCWHVGRRNGDLYVTSLHDVKVHHPDWQGVAAILSESNYQRVRVAHVCGSYSTGAVVSLTPLAYLC
ncbi:uncharacterized protein BJ212DRAFT_1357176 [Suillus subaureus]|uniref:Uncharacterized protein n=1 Tax=Suillus subaureus TaxID=48587 RepID=A0A9P7EAC8_9AGAM|nr:uncharacterized protein BJ212DRAFT_1357176 [Suillus subaureus]KAG1815536.1 hypothetical protein BJ212DRAFT_1357176 [Suillus subaureus]